MTREHIERRFEQAMRIHKELHDGMFLPDATLLERAKIMRTRDYQMWSRIKADQMSRITRRCTRMMRAL